MAKKLKSIMCDLDKRCCWCCQTTSDIEIHHVFFGRQGFRKKAEDDKLLVCLCHDHHQDSKLGVHGQNKRLDTSIKMRAEEIWIAAYDKTKEDFIERYGKNYL